MAHPSWVLRAGPRSYSTHQSSTRIAPDLQQAEPAQSAIDAPLTRRPELRSGETIHLAAVSESEQQLLVTPPCLSGLVEGRILSPLHCRAVAARTNGLQADERARRETLTHKEGHDVKAHGVCRFVAERARSTSGN